MSAVPPARDTTEHTRRFDDWAQAGQARNRAMVTVLAFLLLYSGGAGAEPVVPLPDSERQLIDEAVRVAEETWTKRPMHGELLNRYATDSGADGNVTIQQAIGLALTRDVDLAQSDERIAEADAAARNTRYGYMPRVSLIGEYGLVSQEVLSTDNDVFQEGKADFDSLRFQGEIVQPVLDVERFRALRTAKTGQAAARAALRADAHNVVFRTVSAYLTALEMRSQLDGNDQRLALLTQQHDAESKARQTGYGTADGANLITIEIGAAQAERITLLSSYARALAELSRYIGRPVNGVEPVAVNEQLVAAFRAEEAQRYAQEALSRNPAMQLQRLESLRSQQRLDERKASDFIPVLEVFLRSEWEDRQASRFGGGSETFDTTLGLKLRVPVFNASGAGYASREERSRARQSVLREASLMRELEAEIGTLLPRLKLESEVFLEARRVVDASEALVRSAQKAAGSGYASDRMVLRQTLQSAMARTRADRTYYAFLATRVRLAFLIGESIDSLFAQ